MKGCNWPNSEIVSFTTTRLASSAVRLEAELSLDDP